MTVIERVRVENRRGAFVVLVGLILAIAVGHLVIIEGLTTIVLGLPLWIWAHLAVVGLLLGLAWIATGIVQEDA